MLTTLFGKEDHLIQEDVVRAGLFDIELELAVDEVLNQWFARGESSGLVKYYGGYLLNLLKDISSFDQNTIRGC